MLTDFTKLVAWKKAMELAESIHDLTQSFPKEERYKLVSQMRSASQSVTANIAEGFARFTYPDKKHKYVQARGELVEVMNFLHYCYRVKYINLEQSNKHLALCEDVYRLLNALISKMRKLGGE
jgi:four helix bundle protein